VSFAGGWIARAVSEHRLGAAARVAGEVLTNFFFRFGDAF
jgi:hypothetical protein